MAKNVVEALPTGVTEEDIKAALEMLNKKRERDKVRAAKIASGEIVPKKYKTKPWNELSQEQRDKRIAYSKEWARKQREMAKIAKKYLLDNPEQAKAMGM